MAGRQGRVCQTGAGRQEAVEAVVAAAVVLRVQMPMPCLLLRRGELPVEACYRPWWAAICVHALTVGN